jgi:hypothetical protein
MDFIKWLFCAAVDETEGTDSIPDNDIDPSTCVTIKGLLEVVCDWVALY